MFRSGAVSLRMELKVLLKCMHRHNVSCVKSLQSCLTLCDPMDCSPPGSSVHGILQARILEWVAMPPPGGLPNPGIEPVSLTSPASAGGFFTPSTTWEALHHNDDIKFHISCSIYVYFCDQEKKAFKLPLLLFLSPV